MTVIYDTATIKTPQMQLVADVIDSLTVQGSTGTHLAGNIVIQTAGGAITLATVVLNTPCGSVTNGVLTLSTSPAALTTIAVNTGIAATAQITNHAGASRITGLTVGTSGSDINLNSTSISVGQTVTITSGTITRG